MARFFRFFQQSLPNVDRELALSRIGFVKLLALFG